MAYIEYENGNSKHGEFEVMRESTAELFGINPLVVAAYKERDDWAMRQKVYASYIRNTEFASEVEAVEASQKLFEVVK